MKIALVGATGTVGTRITSELLRRNHQVTGIARHPERMTPQPGLAGKKGNVSNAQELALALRGHDAVISSVPFGQMKPNLGHFLSAIKQAGVKRVLFVGGAGSLLVAPGVQLVDTPNFPVAYKPEALGGRDVLNALKNEQELDWTFLSPSAMMVPGERTGKFRLGQEQLLSDAKGESKISTEDLAVALVDELEKPQHSRQRFTAGY
jgi:putative NADH-flavin reductase